MVRQLVSQSVSQSVKQSENLGRVLPDEWFEGAGGVGTLDALFQTAAGSHESVPEGGRLLLDAPPAGHTRLYQQQQQQKRKSVCSLTLTWM